MTQVGQPVVDAHVRELDQDGLTVLPPYLVRALGPEHADLPGRLREILERLVSEGAAIRRHERNGVPVVEVHDLLDKDPSFGERRLEGTQMSPSGSAREATRR